MAPPCHRARSSEPAADLLTSLPPPLLDAILTRLELRDAVRTSVLSRPWRRRWEALPYISLSFLYQRGTPPVAVDRLLVRYPGHISHFSFYLDEHSVTRADDWLIALCNRGVKSINLQYYSYTSSFNLHSAVFLCTQLVCLDLYRCCIPPLPVGFTGFPVLEELKLFSVEFPENGESQLEAILGASPLLNALDLSFVHIRGDGSNEWVIGGPNLRILTINCGSNYGWRIMDLPRLDEAAIDMGNYVRSGDFEGFIVRLAQVRKLILNTSYPLPQLTNGHLMETLPCTFNNLKSLILWTHFCERPAILSTFCLLMNAPNLEELEITIWGRPGSDVRVGPPKELSAVELTLRNAPTRITKYILEPVVSTAFDSLEEAYMFYNLYPCEVGFSIRYGDNYTNKQVYMSSQELVCQLEGIDKRDKNESARCGCKAMICFHRSDDHGWFMETNQLYHNHPLSESCGEKMQ